MKSEEIKMFALLRCLKNKGHVSDMDIKDVHGFDTFCSQLEELGVLDKDEFNKIKDGLFSMMTRIVRTPKRRSSLRVVVEEEAFWLNREEKIHFLNQLMKGLKSDREISGKKRS